MSGPGERARTDTLGLETDEMRRLGYWVVDRVVEHFEQGADGPAINASPAGDLRGPLRAPSLVPADRKSVV